MPRHESRVAEGARRLARHGGQPNVFWVERGDVDSHVAGEARRVDGLEHLWESQVVTGAGITVHTVRMNGYQFV